MNRVTILTQQGSGGQSRDEAVDRQSISIIVVSEEQSVRYRSVTNIAIAFFVLVACLAGVRESLAADRIRVALTTKDFGYLPLFVGMRAGIFSDEGLDLQWIQVRSNVTTSALIAGEIDVSASAGSAMRVAARGAALKAIFFPYYKCTFVLMGAPDIKTVTDLKGKVIGNNAPGSTTELAANMVLETGEHPAKLKDIVTTPAGCTVDGILELEDGGLRVTLIKAVVRATIRARELVNG